MTALMVQIRSDLCANERLGYLREFMLALGPRLRLQERVAVWEMYDLLCSNTTRVRGPRQKIHDPA